MTDTLHCDVLVVGGGPGGYPAAIRAGQNGLDTILVEADRLGGTCLIRGCIPSKAVIHAADTFHTMSHMAATPHMGMQLSSKPTLNMVDLKSHKDGIVDRLSGGVGGLLKAAGVKVITGWAKFSNAKTCSVKTDNGAIQIVAENVVLATGSTETELPSLPFDGKRVLSSTDALDLEHLPERIAVVGAGYIGMELGIALYKLGSGVTFVEAGPRILPGFDKELTRPVEHFLKTAEIDTHAETFARSAEITSDGVVLQLETKGGDTSELTVDAVIVAIGRRPVLDDWGFETMGIDLSGKFIQIDDQCRTSMSGVYAIGDITGEPMLAHKATAQGEIVADVIAGEKRHFDPRCIPAICFCDPEIVSVGLSPDEAKANGEDVIIGRFPLSASGRALSMNTAEDRGFVRITARNSDHVVLGIHAVGGHVSELSGEFALALEMGAVLEDLAHTIHAHPTLSEATAESALQALGKPIHISAPKR